MQTINKRNIVILLFTMALMFSYSVPAFADGITSVQFFIGDSSYFLNASPAGVNMDVAPYVDKSSGRTLVPVRYLADALGAQTRWDAGTQTVSVSTSVYRISMVIGSTFLTVNGQTQTMDQAPVIKNGRTYLPAKWVANALGYQVDWDAQIQDVLIWPNGTQEPSFSLTNTRAANSVTNAKHN
jgi:hypothetical protein